MKRGSAKVGLIISIAILMTAILVSNAISAPKGLTKIADGVYSYVDVKNGSSMNSFGANAGIVIGKNSIVAIDTLISSKEAKRFIKDIKAVSDKPVKYVVNTHYHLDHTFGNADFRRLGAAIISHMQDNKKMRESAEMTLKNAKNYGLTEKDMKGTAIAYPVLTFSDKMELDLGNQKVELINAGSSHTEGSIMVYLPDKKVLFAGDILFTGYHPFIAEGNIEEWIKVLDYIMTMDVVTIIPGHGPISSKKDIAAMKDYLLAFDKAARELSARSGDAAYIASEIKKVLPSRPEGEWLIQANIQLKYLKK